jgi:asparagine synthase (glutamine-hydrolysing)
LGAVFGLVGEGDMSAVRDMGSRMGHRGSELHVWSPGPGVYFGERNGSHASPDAADPLALDERICRIDAAAGPDRSPRQRLRHIFEAGDLAAMRQVRGPFSAVYWDGRQRALCLAVDHVGYKSLYYCQLPGRVAFASEYKAFFALPDFKPEIDLVAVQYHQALRIAMPWRPSLADVHMVRSGSVARVRGDKVEAEFYWTPRVNETDRPLDEAARLVREQLARTIAEQTRGDEHVGISLSAGIDSAIVAACTREVKSARQVAAYSVGFSNSDPELAGARQVADHLGIEHNVTLFQPDDLRKYLPEMVWLMEDCTAREETLLHLKLFQAARTRVTTMLHGVGADLLFGGMPRHILIALSMRLPILRRPFMDLYQLTQTGQVPRSFAGRALAWKVFKGRAFEPPLISGAGAATFVSEPEDLNRYLGESASNMSSIHYTEPMAEQNEFAFRAPYLDPDAIDLALTIPMEQKMSWGKQKLVLRRAFDSLMPKHITKRPKTIHRLRHDALLSQALDRMASEAGGLEHIRRRRIVDKEYISRLQTRKFGRSYPSDQLYRLWTLVSLEIWLRQFADGGGQYWDFDS